jgi:hypothetical protein
VEKNEMAFFAWLQAVSALFGFPSHKHEDLPICGVIGSLPDFRNCVADI